MTTARVVLHSKRAGPIQARHPWVYAGSVAEVVGEPADGDEVDVYSHGEQFLARGFYNSQSKIRVRLLSWIPDVPLDHDFFRERLASAVNWRRQLFDLDKADNACRLVFSESDQLSGLVVDQFGEVVVVQFTSLAMALRRDLWRDLIDELLHPKGIYVRTERGVGQLEGLQLQDGPLSGVVPDEPFEIEENGIRFLVDVREGQKTGFYLDQRDNRQLVGELAKRLPSSARVLDCFCYSGGFAMYAAQQGRSVLGVDMSEAALQLARTNAERNGFLTATFEKADVFDRLNELAEAGEQFEMVVLDPPKFARTAQAVQAALRGYRRLYNRAVAVLKPGGILVTCCCSGLINQDMLETVMGQVTAELGRPMQILCRRGPAADHPISLHCPETNYLKCLVLRSC